MKRTTKAFFFSGESRSKRTRDSPETAMYKEEKGRGCRRRFPSASILPWCAERLSTAINEIIRGHGEQKTAKKTPLLSAQQTLVMPLAWH